jgi:hypothetical protein
VRSLWLNASSWLGKKGNQSQGIKEGQGQISVDKLRDYVAKYDVRTGKRRAETMSGRPDSSSVLSREI